MPHVTEHTPKVSSRSVYSYARDSSPEKRQQDRRSDRHTDGLSKTTFLDVLRVVHPKSGLISKSIFLHDANTSIDMEVIKNQKNMFFWPIGHNLRDRDLKIYF